MNLAYGLYLFAPVWHDYHDQSTRMKYL